MTDAAKAPPAQPAAANKRARDHQDIDYNFLQRELENIKSPSGESLFEHIKKVFEHMILYSPDKALERFEEISYMIKNGMDPNEFFTIEDIRTYKDIAKVQEGYCKKMKEHFAQPEADEDGNIPMPEPLQTTI